MSAPVEHIKLSKQAKEQLIKLKRLTGIEHWNVLCRWAFCTSLREPSVPQNLKIPADSNLEMTWKVFAGSHSDIFLGLLVQRCKQDRLALTPSSIAAQFRLHVHRGIGYLAASKKIKDIAGLLSMAL
jgi:DNA sulfur modification protein DndE